MAQEKEEVASERKPRLNSAISHAAKTLSQQAISAGVLTVEKSGITAILESHKTPAVIHQRKRIFFLTGLHTEVGVPLLIQLAALNLRKYRIEPKVYKMKWKNGVPFEQKKEELWQEIMQAGPVSLAGVSAGAVPSLIALKELGPKVERVITVCGWCAPKKEGNIEELNALVLGSTAFGQAVEYLSRVPFGKYNNDELARILGTWTRVDEYIPENSAFVPGSRRVIKMPGAPKGVKGWNHVWAIGRTLMNTRLLAEHINS